MNRFKFRELRGLVLFLLIFQHVQADQENTKVNPITIPLPCQSSIRSFTQSSSTTKVDIPLEVNQAAAFFGACDCSDTQEVGAGSSNGCPIDSNNNVSPGVMHEIADALIRSIVGGRIHNLYLGIDSLNYASPKLSSYSDMGRGSVFKPETMGGFGSCAHVGACNPYCGEGGYPALDTNRTSSFLNFTSSSGQKPLSFDIDSLKLFPDTDLSKLSSSKNSFEFHQNLYKLKLNDPDKGGHGWTPNAGTRRLFSGLNNYSHPTLFGVKLSDFFAYGVYQDPTSPDGVRSFAGNNTNSKATPSSGELLPQITPTTTPSSTAFSITAEGWPIQSVASVSSSKDSKICQSARPTDQRDLRSHIAYCYKDAQHYALMNISWNDSSFPSAVPTDKSGGEKCDYEYALDFKDASTISALHTGALVQATWTSLNEVVSDILTKKELTLTDPDCINKAKNPSGHGYLNNLLGSSKALIRRLDGSEPAASYMSERSEYIELRSECASPIGSGNKTTVQASCDKLGLTSLIQGSNFVQLAQCEVLARSKKLFDYAFTGDGRKWVNQIKNWATTSCMEEGEALFEQDPGAGDCWGAAFGTCMAPFMTTCPPCGLFLCPMIVSGVIYNPIETDRCLLHDISQFNCSDKREKSLFRDLLGSGKTKMGNCFPYAYSIALQTYLDKLGFNPASTPSGTTGGKPYQFSYQSKKTISSEHKPQVEINNCQLMDRTPGFQIPSRPTSFANPNGGTQ